MTFYVSEPITLKNTIANNTSSTNFENPSNRGRYRHLGKTVTVSLFVGFDHKLKAGFNGFHFSVTKRAAFAANVGICRVYQYNEVYSVQIKVKRR